MNLDALKNAIPDYAKDVRLSLDTVLGRTSLTPNEAAGCALAAAFAAGSGFIVERMAEGGELDENDIAAAKTAASLMGMTNIWYSYTHAAGDEELTKEQPGLRMQAYANTAGIDKRRFELWALAASIIGKCKRCTRAHVQELRDAGASSADLREVGRIAAVINAASTILKVEQRRV